MTANCAAGREAKGNMAWKPNRTLFLILLYVGLIQAVMLIYDVRHPDIFLHADRASDRMRAIQDLVSFLQGHSSLPEFMRHQGTALGVPGDYLLQGVVFYLGGQYAVIFFQILLFMVSVAALYELTLLITQSAKMSVAATLIYAHLPHGVVFPHMLWSESLFDPLTLISFYFVARCVLRDHRWTSIICSALFLALAMLVRPTVLLWPIIVVATLGLSQIPVRKIIGYVAVFAVIMLAWPSFIWSQTGSFRMTGQVRGGEAHAADDLSKRMQFMIETLPLEQRQAADQRFQTTQGSGRSLPAVIYRYVIFGFTYPAPFIKELAHDTFIFVAQSGIERFTIDYLGLAGDERSAIQNQQIGWRKRLLDEGFVATALIFLRDHGTIFVTSLLGALGMLLIWAFASLGTIAVFLNRTRSFGLKERIVLLSMALFSVYVFLPGQLFNFPQARYRAPAEFCLCVLAIIGWRVISIFRSHAGQPEQNLPEGLLHKSNSLLSG
jgi:hypothetical protein